MTAYLRLLLRRWSRRPAGQAAVLSIVVLTLAVGAVRQPRPALGSRLAHLYSSWLGVLYFGSLFIGSLTVATIEDEKTGGRGRVLRTVGLDGFRALATLYAFSTILALGLPLLGLAASFVIAVGGGLPLAPWLAAWLDLALRLSAAGAVAIAAASLLPRAAALVVVHGMALAVLSSGLAEPMGPIPSGASPFSWRLPGWSLWQFPLLFLLYLGWRRASARVWS